MKQNASGGLPRHVAIIMDGNGRWARERGLPRSFGHRAGARAVREIVRCCRRLEIEALTLYAFSEQNWHRPAPEVEALMSLLMQYVLEERQQILANGIRLRAIGDLERLPRAVRDTLNALIDLSAQNAQLQLCLALSYSGRQELTAAARQLVCDVLDGRCTPDALDIDGFERRLSSGALPSVDLLIRTGGETRLSDFLPWQLAYAELVFSEVMWPDFHERDLLAVLSTFRARQRRFGKTPEQTTDARGGVARDG